MKTYTIIKYILFVGCYLFWVAGAVLIAVGIYAKVSKEGDVVDSLTADPALLFISTGSLMFITTFFGCFGALRAKTLFLQIFLGILVAVVFLQIAATALGFIFSDLVLERTELLMRKGIEQYREDLDLENIIDFVQKKFQCCGAHSYKDWSYNMYFECSNTNPSEESCGVPFSCCKQQKQKSILNTMCGYGTQSLKKQLAEHSIYTAGCLDIIVQWGKNNLLLLGGMAAGLLFIEICMVSLAAAYTFQIRSKTRNKNGKTIQ